MPPSQPEPSLQSFSEPPSFESFDQKIEQNWISQGKDRLLIISVGLPATGKTFTSQRVQRYLQWYGYTTHLFNLGQYRRLLLADDLQDANFFSPSNPTGTSTRDQLAQLALEHCFKYFSEDQGAVAILDATNTSLDRRDMIRRIVSNWPIHDRIQILWLESRCDDIQIRNRNILQTKLHSPDYDSFQNDEDIIKDFLKRIEHYEKVYTSVSPEEIQHSSLSECFIRVMNAGLSVYQYGVQGYLPTRLYFFLLNINLESSPVYLMNSDEVSHSLRELWKRHVDNIKEYGRCQYSCQESGCKSCQSFEKIAFNPNLSSFGLDNTNLDSFGAENLSKNVSTHSSKFGNNYSSNSLPNLDVIFSNYPNNDELSPTSLPHRVNDPIDDTIIYNLDARHDIADINTTIPANPGTHTILPATIHQSNSHGSIQTYSLPNSQLHPETKKSSFLTKSKPHNEENIDNSSSTHLDANVLLYLPDLPTVLLQPNSNHHDIATVGTVEKTIGKQTPQNLQQPFQSQSFSSSKHPIPSRFVPPALTSDPDNVLYHLHNLQYFEEKKNVFQKNKNGPNTASQDFHSPNMHFNPGSNGDVNPFTNISPLYNPRNDPLPQHIPNPPSVRSPNSPTPPLSLLSTTNSNNTTPTIPLHVANYNNLSTPPLSLHPSQQEPCIFCTIASHNKKLDPNSSNSNHLTRQNSSLLKSPNNNTSSLNARDFHSNMQPSPHQPPVVMKSIQNSSSITPLIPAPTLSSTSSFAQGHSTANYFYVNKDETFTRFKNGEISSTDVNILLHTNAFPLGWSDDGSQTTIGIEYAEATIDYLLFESSAWTAPLKIWYAPIISSRTIGRYIHQSLLDIENRPIKKEAQKNRPTRSPNYSHLTNSQLINWRSLSPVSKGILSGYTEEIMFYSHPKLLTDYISNKLDFRWPRGESYKDQLDRAERLIIEISRSNSPILIIAPFSSLRCIIGYFFSIHPLFIPYLHLPRYAIFHNVATAYNNVYNAYQLVQGDLERGKDPTKQKAPDAIHPSGLDFILSPLDNEVEYTKLPRDKPIGSEDVINFENILGLTTTNDSNRLSEDKIRVQRKKSKQSPSQADLNPFTLNTVPIYAVIPNSHVSRQTIILPTHDTSTPSTHPNNERSLPHDPPNTEYLLANNMRKALETFLSRKTCQCWYDNPHIPDDAITFCSCSSSKYIKMDAGQQAIALTGNNGSK
jgi:hypothetical protein